MRDLADKRYVRSWQGTTFARALKRAAVAIGAAALLSGAVVGPAAADEVPVPTAQAVAYNADWVPYLDPPEKPAAVCLVDSGVDVTPDTPEDSPDGPILKRLSLDGGPGTAASSSWEGQHGTRMAFVGGAPINGWGAVGFWPGLRIVSIRAMARGSESFSFDDYTRAMALCRKWSAKYAIQVVNLSLNCSCDPTPAEVARLEDETSLDHAVGLSVVAAAGNAAGPVEAPATTPGVLATAATGPTGLCSFSNFGAEIALGAPGCALDMADTATGTPWTNYNSGTSGASITSSATLALIRSYAPTLTRRGAEDAVTGSQRGQALSVDVEGSFRRAGLAALIEEAKARRPASANASDPGLASVPSSAADLPGAIEGVAQPSASRSVPPRPRVRVLRRRGSVVTVRVSNRPPNATVLIVLQRRSGEFGYLTTRRSARRSDVVSVRLNRATKRLRIAVREHTGVTSTPTFLPV